MQTDRQAGTVIFVSDRSPEATVLQDIEAHGLVMQWARSIRAAVDLLNSPRETTADEKGCSCPNFSVAVRRAT